MAAKTYSMTEGTIFKGIIFFAIPLFFGNLFQQLYNTADSLSATFWEALHWQLSVHLAILSTCWWAFLMESR